MVRLIAALIVLAIVLVVRFFMWLAKPKTVVATYNMGAGQGFGRGPFGPPQGGYGPPQQPGYGPGYGAPPGAMGPGYGAPGGMGQGYGAPQAGYGAAPGMGMPMGMQPMGAPQGGYGQPGAPQMLAQNAQSGVRVLARPDCGFDRLSAALAQSGLQMAGPPGPPAAPGEPSSAMWQSATAQVRYSFDPSTYTRLLEIAGPQAQQLQQHLQAQVG